MTDRLREIEQRCEKATRGPWEWESFPVVLNELGKKEFPEGIELSHTWIRTSWVNGQMKDKMPIVFSTFCPYIEPEHDVDVEEKDADFIAHAREDIPYLLSVIKEQAEEIERLRNAWTFEPKQTVMIPWWTGLVDISPELEKENP